MPLRSVHPLQELEQLEQRGDTLAALFHENSKLNAQTRQQLRQVIGRLLASPVADRLSQSYKCYPHLPQFTLPMAELPPLDLAAVIARRRSVRAFAPTCELSSVELGTILQLTCGITGSLGGGRQYSRAVPSAGALYPVELYVLVQRVAGLPRGVYHYRVAHHALEQLDARELNEWMDQHGEDTGLLRSAAATLVATGVFARATVKYRERGYRFVLLEAGAILQQAGLLAECRSIHSCLLGGFDDDVLNQLLSVDGVREASLLALALGKVDPT